MEQNSSERSLFEFISGTKNPKSKNPLGNAENDCKVAIKMEID
jgi:hypothetical protein